MAAATTEPAVLLSIGEMIDLAIGSPEVGVVDFGMLHTVLHCLAQQLHVQDKNVELRGSVAALPVGKDKAQKVAITEFVVDTEGKLEAPKSTDEKSSEPGSQAHRPPEPESILIVERVKRAEPKDSAAKRHKYTHPTEASKALRKQSQSGSPQQTHGSSSPQAAGSTERLSLVTTSKFNVLESVVEDLKERVYGSLPKNEDILEEVRSQTNLKAITDMWTSLNVSSRLEAAETGIAKLSSLVQDLISDTGGLQDAVREHASKLLLPTIAAEAGIHPGIPHPEGTEQQPGDLPQAGAEQHTGTAPQPGVPGQGTEQYPGAQQLDPGQHSEIASQPGMPPPPPPGTVTSPGAGAPPGTAVPPGSVVPPGTAVPPGTGVPPGTKIPPGTAIPPGTQMPTQNVEYVPGAMGTIPATKEELAAAQIFLQRLHADVEQLRDDFYNAMKDLKPEMAPPKRPPMPALSPLPAAVTPLPTQSTEDSEKSPETGTPAEQIAPTSIANIMTRLHEIERKLKECCESVKKHDGVVHDHINSFQDQLDYLSRQVISTQEFTGSNLTPDVAKDLQGLMKLFQTVQSMQEELKLVHETALQLAAEKEDRQDRINAIIEQIEVLKTIKLDREDMAEAMAEKADLRMLARKVSHDQFELACDDLSRGLDHALGKLNMQEALWQQALDDIQREIEMKLDKMELSPVKEFFNSKLKQLQENLKQIASLRREVEAAGTKRKLLRDVNCISCDAKAVMPMEADAAVPTSKPLPANLSMKPYLSYELDTIRKTQASNLPQRNLHDWEHIDKQVPPTKVPQKVRSEHDKHLCNRYCGGSHTVTTPAQRVARLGHFVKQWGPDVLPLSSGLTVGEDGKMYKVSPAEGTGAGPGVVDAPCTPKMPPKKGEQPKSPEKRSMIANPDCRCLEGEAQIR